MLKPKIFTIYKTITRERFIKDFTAGIIVGIVALPLAIAFGIAFGCSHTAAVCFYSCRVT
ncbi:MAG: hypothetical protein D4R68_06485 [Ignavibacteriales bacterium]|nr:MAG: hypothetical protein D4R68_06485 [Ignavibacteriales bacterium]